MPFFKPIAATPRARPLAAPASPAAATADYILQQTRSAQYAGPRVESVKALRAFVQETLVHAHRVKTLTEKLGGSSQGHDVQEVASVAKVEALARSLRVAAQKDPGIEYRWVAALARQARAMGDKKIEVGKFVPQVAAGLGRSGKPDAAAIALHRLSSHHAGGSPAQKAELVADLADALLSPRGYKPALSPKASSKIIADMIERKLIALSSTDLPVVSQALRFHHATWGKK